MNELKNDKLVGVRKHVLVVYGVIVLCIAVAAAIVALKTMRSYQVKTTTEKNDSQVVSTETDPYLLTPELYPFVVSNNPTPSIIPSEGIVDTLKSNQKTDSQLNMLYEGFDEYLSRPLLVYPRTAGRVIMTPFAFEAFCSAPDTRNGVAQLVYRKNQTLNAYTYDPSDGFEIQTGNCGTKTALNTASLLVGTASANAIALSYDGTRLYVAYQDNLADEEIANALYLPFGLYNGRVQVFSRPLNPDTSESAQRESAGQWAPNCALGLRAALDSYTPGLAVYYNEYRGRPVYCDRFGAVLATGVDLDDKTLMLAAFAEYGWSYIPCVTLFREINDANEAVCEFALNETLAAQLKSDFGAQFNADFTLYDRHSFGHTFALGSGVIAIALRSRQKVLIFRKSTSDYRTYTCEQVLEAASTKEDFGVSIRMNLRGTEMLIGSPMLPVGNVPGVGGFVYYYVYDKDNKWTLADTLSSPSVYPRAFGYFVNVDSSFSVCAVSANQDNRLAQDGPLTKVSLAANLAAVGRVLLVSLKPNSKNFDAQNAIELRQYMTAVASYIDPTFGSSVAMAKRGKELQVLVGEPMNEVVQWFRIPKKT